MISVSIDGPSSDIPSGLIAVDVSLFHPFPGLSQYAGFDVRGIFMSGGGLDSKHYPNLSWASDDEARLLNADGWTRFWNFSEFTSYETIFGYTQGALVTSGFTPTATLNPYKYFSDELNAESPLEIDPETRGMFSSTGEAHTRRYDLQFPVDGTPKIKFAYAIDASWAPPDPDGGPNFQIDDFPLSANCQEAYQLTVTNSGSSAFYVSSANYGGDLSFDLYIYDWQSGETGMLESQVKAVWIESMTLFPDPVDVLTSSSFQPNGPTSSVVHIDIPDVTPGELLNQKLLIGVESTSPANYRPQLDIGDSFVFPDEPLAAYFIWDVPVLDNDPLAIPVPQVYACGARLSVEIHISDVNWPTLDGYNVYRKISSEPDFDFVSPLNTSVIHDNYFYDYDVLADGTTYDYVVKTVDLNTSESEPSEMISATPEYIAPTGFIDLDAPLDGDMGDTNLTNIVNANVDVDGNVYLVWDTYETWEDFKVNFCRGNINDGMFGETIEVGDGDKPDVAFDSEGTAHIAWGYPSGPDLPTKRYFYNTVTADGTVGTPEELHSFTYGNWWCVEPTIAVTPDDEVHIVFTGYSSGYGVLYIHGHAGDWSPVEKISGDITGFLAIVDPDLKADKWGDLHVAWVGSNRYSILYSKRDTSGVWSPAETVHSVSDNDATDRHALDVDRLGVAHISFNQTSNFPILNDQSPMYTNNRSGTWMEPIEVHSDLITNGPVGVACDKDGNAYVNWYTDTGDQGWQVYCAMIDTSDNIVTTSMISDNSVSEGVIPSFTGITHTCYEGDASVISWWVSRSPNEPPNYSRIQAEY
jgi:hypothetical protein